MYNLRSYNYVGPGGNDKAIGPSSTSFLHFKQQMVVQDGCLLGRLYK